MTSGPSWTDRARRMLDAGETISNIAAAIGVKTDRIRYHLDIDGRKARYRATSASWKKKDREANKTVGAIRTKQTPQVRNERDAIERAYADPKPVSKPTLPAISILTTPVNDAAPRASFAPRSTVVREAPGVDRWRTIHREMIRAGKLPERGTSLVDQFHA